MAGGADNRRYGIQAERKSSERQSPYCPVKTTRLTYNSAVPSSARIDRSGSGENKVPTSLRAVLPATISQRQVIVYRKPSRPFPFVTVTDRLSSLHPMAQANAQKDFSAMRNPTNGHIPVVAPDRSASIPPLRKTNACPSSCRQEIPVETPPKTIPAPSHDKIHRCGSMRLNPEFPHLSGQGIDAVLVGLRNRVDLLNGGADLGNTRRHLRHASRDLLSYAAEIPALD
jgi:hypothetical protein